jgi:hypothetical protein
MLFGSVDPVRVPELPGRVGIDQVERPLGQGWCLAELGVA